MDKNKRSSGMDKSILILLKHIGKINKKLDEILELLNKKGESTNE